MTIDAGSEELDGGADGLPGDGTVRTGIEELDRRLDGLPEGGLYLLSATPGNARAAAVLQFAAAGLANGGRLGLVTRARPDRLFREAEDYGLSLEELWREGRLVLLGLRGEYEMRLRRAGSPEAVFRELASLMEPMPKRVVFDPGTPLWEGRGDGATASAFVDFLEESGATALATTTADLNGGLTAATELVARAAEGVFQLETTAGDLVRLRVLKLGSGERGGTDVTLELVPGRGLVAVGEEPGRRSGSRMPTGRRRALVLTLGGELPGDLEAWLEDRYDVEQVAEPMGLVSRLQEDESCGTVLLLMDRKHVTQARRACRVSRRVRPDVAVVLMSGDSLRARDRADLLEDGADELISGRVNVQEFSARLARARAGAGRRPAPAGEPADRGGPDGPTVLGTEAFRDRLRRRLEADPLQIFSVVLFRSGDPVATLETLAEVVRGGEGDVVGPVSGRSAVLLSDTRTGEAEDFAARAASALARDGAAPPDVEVLGSLRDTSKLRSLIG